MRRPSGVFWVVLLLVWWLFNISILSILLTVAIASVAAYLSRAYLFEQYLQNAVPKNNPVVVITGCSTGLGKSFALHLSKKGFTVFAGVRKLEDARKLRDELPKDVSSNLIPLLCDVTKPEQIEQARDTVQKHVGEKGIFGLVNNAGIASFSPIEAQGMTDIRNIFETNLFGGIAMQKAFGGMLRQYYKNSGNRSRLVWTSSIGGLMALQFGTVYQASKFAVEGVVDGSRAELKPLGVDVTAIEPGAFDTEMPKIFQQSIPEKTRRHLCSEADLEAWKVYESRAVVLDKGARDFFKIAAKPHAVAVLLERILLAKYPPSRALVGLDAFVFWPLIYLAPDGFIDIFFRAMMG